MLTMPPARTDLNSRPQTTLKPVLVVNIVRALPLPRLAGGNCCQAFDFAELVLL